MGEQADAVAAALTAHIEEAAKALVLAIVANLVKVTPVATGWARANWIPSIGSAVEATAGESPEHGGEVSTAEQEAGITGVLSFKLASGLLYVANNVPYIMVLNYGTSQQAPAGFVEFAIDQALQEVERNFGVDFGLDNFRQQALAAIAERAAYKVQKEVEKLQKLGAAAANNLASAFSPFGGDQ